MDGDKVGEFKLLIGGKLVPGDMTMPVINPATGEVLADAPRASEAQFNAAVAAAKAAFPAWAAKPFEERRALVIKVADVIEANGAELARLLTQEQGKPLAHAKGEVGFAVALIRQFGKMELKPHLIEETKKRRVEAHRVPLGVVAAITPWNFPLTECCFKFPPALMAGNTVVLKPAASTPLTTLKLGELLAGVLPAGVLNIVTDANDLGGVLTGHPDVRKVTFTGSTNTGKKVMASSAGTLKRVTLELGGNDAAILLDDVDPVKVAPQIFMGAFFNAGQVCLAIKRLYVHESIYDRMCDEMVKLADATVVGDGLTEGVQMGPMQNRMQYEKVKGLVEEAQAKGEVIAGGVVKDQAGFFIRPTIVRNAKEGDRLVDEEQFGPILPLIKYSDPEDALRRANATTYGLGGSVWSKDPARARALAARLEAGTVWVNKHQDIGPTIPFGGAKQSGMGVEFGQEGLEEFTQLQVINEAL
jgi:acyl-CoA reductase-like NAD-dependent aldehyde dehydrogenase